MQVSRYFFLTFGKFFEPLRELANQGAFFIFMVFVALGQLLPLELKIGNVFDGSL